LYFCTSFKKTDIKMALIGQIRKHSGLLVVVIGVALAAFVLGDFLKPSQQRQENYIGEVGGIEITSQEFFQKVSEQEQVTKEQRKTDKLEAQDLFQIRQSIWNQFVQEIIMAEEYLSLGLTVTTDELSEQILGENPHKYVQQSFTNPNTQMYDPEMVKSFLQNLDGQSADMKQRYLNLETMVKEDRLKTKYNTLITKAYSIPEAFAKLDYINNNRKVDFRFVAPKFSAVADSSVAIIDADLKEYYKEYEYNYKQDEVRSVDFVIFEVKPSQEDRKNIASEVNKLYAEFKTTDDVTLFVNSVSDTRYDSTYKKEADLSARIAKEMFESPIGTMVGPYIENEIYNIAKLMDRQERADSIMMSQLLISYASAPSGMNLSERTKEEAETLVDSLLFAIEKDPEKFEDLTVEFSNYPTAADDKGDLGWIVDGNPGFTLFYNEAADVKVGGVKKMETALGFHIIKVSEKTEAIEKVRVAIVTRAIEPSNETFQETYLAASTFAGENPTLAQFDTAVVNQGLNKRSADRLDKMSNRIAGVENPRQIIRWSFFDRTELGTVSPVFEDGKNYIVAVLKDITPEGFTPFEKVKEQIRPLVLNLKKGDVLVERINALNAQDLYQIASKMDEKVDTATDISFMARNIPGFGRENEVIGKLMTLEAGKLSAPLKGNNAVFVVLIDEIKEPNEIDVYSIYANQLESAFKNKITANAPYKALEEKTEIFDNRLMFY
jgi:peptidyl-prolyl cis-trans isomerase D